MGPGVQTAALEVVGSGLVANLVLKLDGAYFRSATSNGPSGIPSVVGVQTVDGGSLYDLDPFAEALSKAENVGSTITAFVGSPANILALSTIKVGSGFTTQLLAPDPTSPSSRSVLGVPLYSSPAVDDTVIWGIPRAKTFVVLREDAQVAVDTSAFFSSDRTAVRCTMRAAFGFPHPAAIIKIGIGGS